MNIFQVDALSCGYNTKNILDNISFSVNKGDFLGIIGPNGAGKTTLFKVMTRILKPFFGKILYKDKDIYSFSLIDFAREIAVIPQFLEIPFSYSVEEFVLMGRFPHNGRFTSLRQNDYRILENVLSLTDTSHLRRMNMSELSGGERQRVVLAQGFAQEPSVLFLDEPTAHLDITHQVQTLNLIKKLNKEKKITVIIILHDLNLASSYCNRLILLNQGKIFKKGSPSEVLTYQNIEEVYKTVVLVKQNPLNSKPYVVLVTDT
ncbi:MAG: ABC transporter ATP-binding protein [bacterium]